MTLLRHFSCSPAKAGVQTRRTALTCTLPRATDVADWTPAFAGERVSA